MPVKSISPAEKSMQEKLDRRKSEGLLRILRPENNLIDFCSNDYLGFARSPRIRSSDSRQLTAFSGSTGSRLIRGNNRFTEELEDRIAAFHKAESGLIYNSGYDANLGLFSSIASRGDTIIYDALIHASVRDGIRLSGGNAFRFVHNDCSDLEEKLKAGKGNLFVAVESIYSMDGDASPLEEIAELCMQYGANLIVDEAHASGVFGSRGEGLVAKAGLESKVFARLHTFGKALGCHGGIVLGSKVLRDFQINFSRAFIYTTALPPVSLQAISAAYDKLETETGQFALLHEKIVLFREIAGNGAVKGLMSSGSPIQCVVIPGNEASAKAAAGLIRSGCDVKAILSPTVPRGSERLRLCLHVFNTEEEIKHLVQILGGLDMN